MTLDAILKSAADALAAMEADKFGRKSVTHQHKKAAGVVTVTMAQIRTSRRFSSYHDTKVTTQVKLDGKVISRDALRDRLGDTRRAAEANPVLTAAFMARAPELAAEFAAYIRRAFEYQKERHEGRVPAYPETTDGAYSLIATTLRPVCDTVRSSENDTGPARHRALDLQINEEKLAAASEKYGKECAANWLAKTNAKLGDVEDCEVIGESSDLIVHGSRAGQPVRMVQQRILKASPKGVLFHQFPARLYVGGKFTTEAAYKRLFA